MMSFHNVEIFNIKGVGEIAVIDTRLIPKELSLQVGDHVGVNEQEYRIRGIGFLNRQVYKAELLIEKI